MTRFVAPAVVAVAVSALSGSVSGQEPRGQSGSERSAAPRPAETAPASRANEESFVKEMGIAGMTEVQLGRLASERASHNEVKEFGQMMIKDHSRANDELEEIAAQLRVQMPAELDQKHKDLHARLSGLQGAEFDREYMSAMVKGHEEVLGKLKARTDANLPPPGAGNTPGVPGAQASDDKSSPARGDVTGRGRGDERLTLWAAKTMPAVQQHLDRARQVHQKVAK